MKNRTHFMDEKAYNLGNRSCDVLLINVFILNNYFSRDFPYELLLILQYLLREPYCSL